MRLRLPPAISVSVFSVSISAFLAGGCLEMENPAPSSGSNEARPNYSTLPCGDTCGNSSDCMTTCRSMEGPTAPYLHESR